MVSIRRRRLLGLYSGQTCFLAPLPKSSENGYTSQNCVENTKQSVHPMPLNYIYLPKEKTTSETCPTLSKVSAFSPLKEEPVQPFPVSEFKRRKRHRRKHVENQEQCIMRGVYFKNMKWQAAIKVDKKQIHLGTVGSQEEAARLYDRAAFMCGRQPNFELSEEEKQELRKFKWEDFLAITRSAITSKKSQKRTEPGFHRQPHNNEWDGEQGSEDDPLVS
ncbi:unnamed protein product [Fraxinus pennsylvanica]|uniref:AP2/ERF domain-containing protein n=1 Tax=Fraxinus pennsylvanica TaxID=56036 RepID=A0AAD1Z198_9LAMI|nr:unnamed protein product [Fraxinus pennsylvanica]